MKTINKILNDYKPGYDLSKLAELEKILFIDIETTGLTARNSNLYMIGCVFYKNDNYNLIQWVAENYEEELQILTSFFEFANNYSYLIHYNGNNFDIPYLLTKCEQFELDYNFDDFNGVDIYRRIYPYKDALGLLDLKQKTIEQFLGLNREDQYTGRELISMYHDYVCSHNIDTLDVITLHNEEDLSGMLTVVAMLSYCDLFNEGIKVMKASANYFNDINQKRSQEIIMKLKLLSPLPAPISFRALGCYFSGDNDEALLKVPLYEEEMKYFYSNYTNYYYLPAEDIAMHKSVATFVDKAHRVQASASNCYTRKKSLFLPQWDVIIEPFYKKEYKSKDLYFELTDEFKKDRKAFNKYASHILNSMLKSGIE